MTGQYALCLLGFHVPPDPNTPPEQRYHKTRDWDCGYPPYQWQCSACHSFYGRHTDLPHWNKIEWTETP